MPLGNGQSLRTPPEFLEPLTHSGTDIVQPDICAVDGIAQMRWSVST